MKTTGKFSRWLELPGELMYRWDPLKSTVKRCFDLGLVVHILPAEMTDVTQAGYAWGGPAVYQRWNRHLAMTVPIAYGLPDSGYGQYAGDIHELGHAIRFLLISGFELWLKIRPLFNAAKQSGRFLDHYSSTSIEEFFAQGFEAFWTAPSPPSDLPVEWQIDWSRDDLFKRDPAFYAYMEQTMQRLGADVSRLIG